MRLDWEQDVVFDGVEPGEACVCAPFQLVADCCQMTEGAAFACAAHVLLTNDEHIRQINAQYRGLDKATDVLSFPSVTYPKGKTARDCEKRLRPEYDPELNACVLGDIMISIEHARAQAAEYGHSVRRELCYLLTHGLFHIMGYDHIDPEDQKEMRSMEEKALQAAGVTRGDTPAVPDDGQLLSLATLAMQNSYCPYSRYAVGAALLSEDGRVYQGCNIENASFGLTNCAERTALFKAVSEGARAFTTIAIASNGTMPYPCGACRQALNEFAPGLRVLMTDGEGKTDETTLAALLPHGFGPKSLNI